jgi:methyl-accepting chemotaxis protein
VQIAVSSQQQLAGMDQVALAMENIQQASTENAAGSRQAEASAQNLHALGQSLRQIVDRFQF